MGNKYKVLGECKISDTRSVTLSEFDDGNTNGYTLAQKAEIQENGINTQIYLNGAFHFSSLENVQKLKQMLDMVINNFWKN